MNRSNVMEIKKTLKMSPDTLPSIDTICTCYVNGNKEKLISNSEKFINLEEEEQFKYLEILKGCLTGTVGKKLINLGVKEEFGIPKIKGGIADKNGTKDELFDGIIESYDFGENYLIVAAHGVYDAPVKTSDGKSLEDETNTYDFMMCAICPVHLTKAGLTLNTRTNRMESAGQIQIVEAPINGFLYPAFNERQSDDEAMLYFTKKPEEQHPELIEALTGYKAPTSSAEQQSIFENIIAEVTNDSADFDMIKDLHEALSEKASQGEAGSEDKVMTKDDLKDVLKEVGVSADKLSDFDHIYERAGGDKKTKFVAQNLMELDKFKVKAPDIEIKIKPDKTGLVQKKKVDGKNCIVVFLEGDIELNGIQVSEEK